MSDPQSDEPIEPMGELDPETPEADALEQHTEVEPAAHPLRHIDRDLETPEADAIEQHTEVEPAARPLRHIDRDLETPEADAIDQHLEVPADPDDR